MKRAFHWRRLEARSKRGSYDADGARRKLPTVRKGAALAVYCQHELRQASCVSRICKQREADPDGRLIAPFGTDKHFVS